MESSELILTPSGTLNGPIRLLPTIHPQNMTPLSPCCCQNLIESMMKNSAVTSRMAHPW